MMKKYSLPLILLVIGFIVFLKVWPRMNNPLLKGGDIPIPSEIYARDKAQIADCFIRNVDYYRLYYYHNLYNPPEDSQSDPCIFYWPFVHAYGSVSSSGLQTRDVLRVVVDTIVYNTDGLKCFILLVIKEKAVKKDKILGVKKGREYNALAMVGFRNHVSDSMKVFPFSPFLTFGMPSYQEALEPMKDYYGVHLRGNSWRRYGNVEFRQNVGAPDFFEKTPLFKHFNDTLYYCQVDQTFKDSVVILKYHFAK